MRTRIQNGKGAAITLSILMSGCVMADIGAADDPGLEEIEFAAENGIFLDNGLNLPNGMNLGNGTTLRNGMNLGNGIDLANGMNLGNGIVAPPAGSGLEQWIDVDPPMRKKTLRYLVECALPTGMEVQLTYRGTVELLGTGALGLGPSLQEGELVEEEQQAVSACMLARVNGWGDAVSIDLFGAYPGLDGSTANDAPFRRFEATYFGNVFAPDPVALVCTQNERSCGEMRGCRSRADGTCDCGLFDDKGLTPGNVNCGNGFTNDLGINGYQCAIGPAVDDTHYYMTDCVDEWGTSWAAPITVWFAPRANGETCRYDDMCDSWSCNAGACAARKTSGGTCDSNVDCLNSNCTAGFCGSPTGSYCVSGVQCRSGSCSKKHVCL